MLFQDAFRLIPESRRNLLYVSELREEYHPFLFYMLEKNDTSTIRITLSKESEEINFSTKQLSTKDLIDQIFNKDELVSRTEIGYTSEDENIPDQFLIPEKRIELHELEPHTLFNSLQLKNKAVIEPYPSRDFYISSVLYYAYIPPEYRFKYINWLKDTTKPIERHFIMIYLSGMERRALETDTDEVINEILLLINSHDDTHVLKRCRIAINNIFYYRNELPKLFSLYQANEKIKISNHLLEYFIINRIELKSNDLLSYFNEFGFKVKIIENYEHLFIKALEEILITKYGSKEMPFGSKYSLNKLPKTNRYFSNKKLHETIGNISVYDFSQMPIFSREVSNIYELSYSLFKTLKKLEKNASSND
jgi:hypothetical protein